MIGDSRPISLKVEADAGTVISREAVSIGLIVTELVMNALKHAFPVTKPDAAIVVSYKAANWRLTISDNGIGKPDVKASRPGLGTSLIKALTRQLELLSVDRQRFRWHGSTTQHLNSIRPKTQL